MPATLLCAGPAHIYVALPRSAVYSGITYLGTTIGGPRWQVRRAVKPIPNDISGGPAGEPFDLSLLGKSAIVSLDLGRFDPLVLDAVFSIPNSLGDDGLELFGDIGTIAGLEGAYTQLWIQHPYAAKPAQAAVSAPVGYRFLRAVPIGPDDFAEQGTITTRRNVIFQTVRAYDHTTGNMRLYDKNMAGVPAFPPS